MPFPTTPEGLIAAGYKKMNTSHCQSCNAEMQWYETPRGKKIPMNAGTAIAHFSTCPNAKEFRKK